MLTYTQIYSDKKYSFAYQYKKIIKIDNEFQNFYNNQTKFKLNNNVFPPKNDTKIVFLALLAKLSKTNTSSTYASNF